MQQEIEAKFLNIDHVAMRTKLKELGAVCEHPMRLMKRELFDYADGRMESILPKRRLRLRDEGDKQTFTFKQASDDSEYNYEAETVVSSYDETKRILEGIGLKSYTYQESKRETWAFGSVEVVLDEWPWLDTYIEIEGPSETEIKAAAVRLGLDWADAKFGSVETAYRAQYPGMKDDESIGVHIKDVRFDLPMPDFLKERQ